MSDRQNMPIDPRIVQNYADRITTELRQNILPFWMKYGVDREKRIVLGSLTNDLVLDRSVPRGALLSARVLWTFSAAYRLHRDPAYLEMAQLAYDDLLGNFWDREHSGFFWSIAANGTPLETRKQIYGQAFGVYALTEYHRVTGLREPLDRAIGIYQLIEKHARDRKDGGYIEAFSRKWEPIEDMRLSAGDMNAPKSQNTHLHVMEAYTNLLRVWPEAKESLGTLVDVMLERILTKETGHLKLFFAMDWKSLSEAVSYGHDIEAGWLFMEAADALGDAALKTRLTPLVLKIADATLAQGVDADGGVYNLGNQFGVTDFDKEWWPQAEAVVGFLCAYQLSGYEHYLKAALHSWDFIDKFLVDRKHGEWIRGVDREGRVLASHLKVSFWKCPYHNGRACMEAGGRLSALVAQK